MEEKGDVFKRFRESFSRMDGRFHVLEQRVPVELQMEYFKHSEQMRKTFTPLTDEEFDANKQSLFDSDEPIERKKELLSTFAVSNDVKSYRVLEKYVEHPEPDIANWAYMALMESRISLESELLEERQVYISTGLGGKGNKLRFYILILGAENKPFEPYQRQVIEREFPYALERNDCEIERLSIADMYVELVFLIPVSADIKAIFDGVIAECNQYGNFLSHIFTVTNVKELTSEEIAKLIKKRYGDNSQTGD